MEQKVYNEPKKITAEFSFTEDYYTFKKNQAEVILTIDYKTKTYCINPVGKCGFVFKNCRKDSLKLHSAVIKAIEAAILFAENELP